MIIDRRTFAAGAAATAAAFAAPRLIVEPVRAQPAAAAAVASGLRSRDPAFCDPWLIQVEGGAPTLVVHEATGAMFRPSCALRGARLQGAGMWEDYAPPYTLARLSFDEAGKPARLHETPSPRANKVKGRSDRVDMAALSQAAERVVDHCLAKAPLMQPEAWLMARPRGDGESLVKLAPRSGYGAPEDQSFPIELRARLAPSAPA
jgi:hypothetical protein